MRDGSGIRRGARAGVLAVAVLCSAALPTAGQKAPLQGLDAYIGRAMTDWGVAGLSIAVVQDDSVVFIKGYGVREAGKPAPVDANTVFAIGSNTKFFTAVAAGTLVDEGRFSFDDHATKWLPDFRLYDPWVTREITIRDMLSHRSGLGRRGDLLWYGSPYSRAEVLRRIRYLEPNTSFRSQFGYQNIMVMGAGQAAAAAAGMSWDALVKERILQPLGMSSTTTSVRELAAMSDVASPHIWIDGHPVPIAYRDIDNIAPAGSINSSARDMAQWLRLILGDGRYAGHQVIKPATLHDIESPQTISGAPHDTLRPSTHFVMYGLGIGMSDYKGVKVLQHTGGIDGMLSLVAMVPERHFGLVVLTNTQGHNDLFTALMYRVLDAYLGGPTRDWSAIGLAQAKRDEVRAVEMEKKLEAARVPNTTPSLALEKYAGTYTSELYGDAVVTLAGDTLSLRFGPSFAGTLEHWNYDTFRAHWTTGGRAAETLLGRPLVTFTLGADGRPASLEIQGIATFERAKEKAAEQERD